MDRRFVIGGGAAAVIAVAGGGYFLMSRPDEALADTASSPVATGGSAAASDVDTSGIKEMVLGDENAPITVMEYASFTCPHCAHWHETSWDKLKSEYIDTGKVKFVYRDVYFDRYGLWAAMIARCDTSKFFGLVDMFYETQDTWLRGAKTEADIADNLRKIGRVAGLTDEAMEECLNDMDKAKALTVWYQKNATDDGITGTPSFVIDGETHSNMAWADFKAILDAKLG